MQGANMITITSKKDGFRRCGIAHPGASTTYPDDAFSAKQLKILQGEPMLTVVVSEQTGGGNDERLKNLAAACGKLDPDTGNKEHWTTGGVPQTAALEALSGEKNVTAAERDAAWKAFNEAGGR
jgi:hypothetical protein